MSEEQFQFIGQINDAGRFIEVGVAWRSLDQLRNYKTWLILRSDESTHSNPDVWCVYPPQATMRLRHAVVFNTAKVRLLKRGLACKEAAIMYALMERNRD